MFPALFKSTINDYSFFPATGESITHLHCALDRRMLTIEDDEKELLGGVRLKAKVENNIN